ncbi:hypothetical protein NE237_027536 [Protea cynaroides]|uniref:Uncharacterized protein n=1 Tax=Protea cynaroides TaxID=273540 RepID=A0A9Q0JS12_9MAGN|nr:hypothetical protein NE237_027536 [Protea cynaroides]
MFASPVPTFYKIWKKGDVDGFRPDPYLASVINCALWILYGQPFVHPGIILVVTINSVGFTLELSYILIYIFYAPSNKRTKVLLVLLAEALFFLAVATFSLKVYQTQSSRSLFVGIFCSFFGVCMSMSPLTVMGK